MTSRKNKNTIAIMQPTFLPWIGYFGLMMSVENFVYLDDVQFSKQSWQSRNKIKNTNGSEQWLSVPIKKHSLDALICDIEIQRESKDFNKIVKSLKYSYSSCENYTYISDIISRHLSKKLLADLNIAIIEEFKGHLGIKCNTFRSSSLNISSNSREKKLVKIIEQLGCKNYISPPGSKDYLNTEDALNTFENSSINIEYFSFNHPTYNQIGNNFVSYLSIVDCLFNLGFHETSKLIKAGIS